MGLLRKALHGSTKSGVSDNVGLLKKALIIHGEKAGNTSKQSRSLQKKNDLGSSFSVSDYQPCNGDNDSSINIRENLPPDAINFVKQIIDTTESVLFIRIQFDPDKNTSDIFTKNFRAISQFFTGNAFVFSNKDYTIGIMSRFEKYDQDLLLHQLRTIIRNNQEIDESSFSFTVDCISDIKV